MSQDVPPRWPSYKKGAVMILTGRCRAKAKAAAAYACEEVGERSTKDRVKARTRSRVACLFMFSTHMHEYLELIPYNLFAKTKCIACVDLHTSVEMAM
jgi:hypothetical protein